MFTGIIETVGEVMSLADSSENCRIKIGSGGLDLADVRIGDSIAVSGCCLTVVEFDRRSFSADVSRETLRCTTLGSLRQGSRVNLEKAMQVGDRFGGHIVSGHVDGVGFLRELTPAGSSLQLVFEAPDSLACYIAEKGSICIDGTSLTVNQVEGTRFAITVIPHTQEATVIGGYEVGQAVNLEADVVARYLERLMQGSKEMGAEASSIDQAMLEKHGFKSV